MGFTPLPAATKTTPPISCFLARRDVCKLAAPKITCPWGVKLAITEILRGAMDHYAVETGVVVVLIVLTLAWNLLARGVTVLFVKIKVEGDWDTEIDRGDGFKGHEFAKLRQFFNKVWGHSTTKAGKTYSVEGTVTGDRLCLIYRATSGGSDFGACLLEIREEGDLMEGQELGVDHSTHKLYAYPYKWTRR
jgi:hypothetical protein